MEFVCLNACAKLPENICDHFDELIFEINRK